MAQTFTLRIAESYSPTTMPLARLGEYLTALGEFLGETGSVHFDSIKEGSTMLCARADHEAAPKVVARVHRISIGEATDAEAKAYARIDDMLRDDNATGRLFVSGTNVIHVDFEGRNRPRPMVYGPVKQAGVIDGEIFRIEGRDSTVHIGVVDGKRSYSLEAPASRAHELAQYFRTGPIRFKGEGTWHRNGEGRWELRRFRIESLAALDDTPLSEAIQDLRNVGIGDWQNVDDPLQELADERREESARH